MRQEGKQKNASRMESRRSPATTNHTEHSMPKQTIIRLDALQAVLDRAVDHLGAESPIHVCSIIPVECKITLAGSLVWRILDNTNGKTVFVRIHDEDTSIATDDEVQEAYQGRF